MEMPGNIFPLSPGPAGFLPSVVCGFQDETGLRSAAARIAALTRSATRSGGAGGGGAEAQPEAVHEHAREHGISIAPGPIFSVRDKYRNYIRISAAHWSDEIDAAIRTLGSLAGDMA